ncbi:WD repeat-containing protein 60 [Parelaphostrongylus tenuis]|uniref:WD repeat-containing protein 60 n=1 Tax=Parelaphostrongylus tenuis TaxID=148309 RepID=A0AAD5R793_PARTN|nr:WD repeat-containing protein 60 [Parelaphostrongylus tenuis]
MGSDEFEDEEDSDEITKILHEKSDDFTRSGIPPRVSSLERIHRKAKKATADLPSRKLSNENSTSVAERMVEDTPLLRRLASRQGGRSVDPSPPLKPTGVEEKTEVSKTVEKKRIQYTFYQPPACTTLPVGRFYLFFLRQLSRIASATSRIDFTSTSDVNQNAVAQADERYRKLNSLIMIEHVTYTIVDQPPIKDYDFYMELFGRSGKSLLSTQTGDDNLNEETQTEETLNAIKWTQHPPRDGYGWGTESGIHVGVNSQEDVDMTMFRENHLQNPRLKRTPYHVTSLLFRSKLLTYSGDISYSLVILGIGSASRVTTINFNPKQQDVVLVGFFVEESPAEDIVNRTLLVEYFMENDRPPKRLFISEGEVTSTSYNGDSTTLVAGVNDGVVEVYDLLEPSPVFSSSLPWIAGQTRSGRRRESDRETIIEAIEEDPALSTVASLDESGSISLWIVLRDSQGRPGVRPQSQLSLQLIALIRPDPFVMRSSSQPTPLLATCMVTCAHPSLFIVGFKGVYGEVLCVRMSPFVSSMILVGFSTGSLAVYNVAHINPLVVLTPPASLQKPVISVEWSPISSTVLYSLHGHTRLLVWDLSVNNTPQNVHDLSRQCNGNMGLRLISTAHVDDEPSA